MGVGGQGQHRRAGWGVCAGNHCAYCLLPNLGALLVGGVGNKLVTVVGSVDGGEGGRVRRKGTEDILGCSLFHTHYSKFLRE